MPTAGLATLVEEVNQYAPVIQAATSTATFAPALFPPQMTSSNPTVATTSENHVGPPVRTFVDISTNGCANIIFAMMHPAIAPLI